MANYSPKYAKIGLFPFSDGCFLSEKNMLKKKELSFIRFIEKCATQRSILARSMCWNLPLEPENEQNGAKTGFFYPYFAPFHLQCYAKLS